MAAMAEAANVIGRIRKRQRKALTLRERVMVIERSDQGETAIAIANSLGVGKTQIQTIVKEKEAILGRWYGGESGDKKYCKLRRYAVIDEQVWEWFCEMRQKNIPVTRKLIQEKAWCLAVNIGVYNFQASNGWLEKWLKRHVYQSGENKEIKQCSIYQTHKKAPVVEPSNISKRVDPFVMRLMVQTMVSQLMPDSSLEKYQADKPKHVGDPNVTATALSCQPVIVKEEVYDDVDIKTEESDEDQIQTALPTPSVVVKEEVYDDVDIKTEESDEDQIQTALPTPSDTDSSSHDMLDDNTFVITATSCTKPDTKTAWCLPVVKTATEMLDGNIFVTASTPYTKPDTKTIQHLPIMRTASEMTSRKLMQRYSHVGKGLIMNERERCLCRKYMKSETDRNISEVKINKVKKKIALLKKQKLQLQILMQQKKLNLQNR